MTITRQFWQLLTAIQVMLLIGCQRQPAASPQPIPPHEQSASAKVDSSESEAAVEHNPSPDRWDELIDRRITIEGELHEQSKQFFRGPGQFGNDCEECIIWDDNGLGLRGESLKPYRNRKVQVIGTLKTQFVPASSGQAGLTSAHDAYFLIVEEIQDISDESLSPE